MRNIVDIIAPLSSNAAEFVSLGSLISQILRDYASELGSPAEGARFWCAWLCVLYTYRHHCSTKQEMEDFTRTHFHLLGFERYAATAGKATFVASFLGTVRTFEERGLTAENCTQPRLG